MCGIAVHVIFLEVRRGKDGESGSFTWTIPAAISVEKRFFLALRRRTVLRIAYVKFKFGHVVKKNY